MQHIDKLRLAKHKQGVVLPVKAVPGSSRDRISGVLGDRLKVAVSAAAEKGKANKAIASLLAKKLSISTSSIELLNGTTNPNKDFLLIGLEKQALVTILESLQAT